MKINRSLGGVIIGMTNSDNMIVSRVHTNNNLSIDRYIMGKPQNLVYQDSPAGLKSDDIEHNELDLKIVVNNGNGETYLNVVKCGTFETKPFEVAKVGFFSTKSSESSYSFLRVTLESGE